LPAPLRRIDKIEELEGVRGLAAMIVVFFHMPEWNPWIHVNFTNNGYLMVQLFFVLSGFVIFNAYGDRIRSGTELASFQFLRFGRLYPTHLLFLTGFLLFEIIKWSMPSSLNISPEAVAFGKNSGTALVEQLLLLQAIVPDGHAYTFNAPAWSISTEFYTYMLFGLTVLFARRIELILFAAIAGCCFVTLPIIGHQSAFYMILSCFTGFFLGCLVCSLVKDVAIKLPLWTPIAVIAAIAIYLSMKPLQKYDQAIFPLSALLVLALRTSRPGAALAILRARGLIRLGTLSYAVYMSHSLVISVLNIGLKRGLHLPEGIPANGVPTVQLPLWGAIGMSAVAICATLTVSAIVYRFVEVPFRSLSRTYAAKWFSSTPRRGADPVPPSVQLAPVERTGSHRADASQ
jgi:peptidoglycan/LPS O-acetylase OafA/YrhL